MRTRPSKARLAAARLSMAVTRVLQMITDVPHEWGKEAQPRAREKTADIEDAAILLNILTKFGFRRISGKFHVKHGGRWAHGKDHTAQATKHQ